MPAIRIRNLCKTFKVPLPQKKKGVFASIKHFITHPTKNIDAVKNLSFDIERGEILGFLGANGSGKSTTIKMLTGILTPTSGQVEVLGFTPHKQRRQFTPHIGLVLGQKSLLWWNIPVLDSFKLYRDIYNLKTGEFNKRLDSLCELLAMTPLLHIPVRKLSLGQRMRAEICASLLHHPEVIFLDEPTIGLDVLGRKKLKDFIKYLNQTEQTTVILTSHNMFDVEDLCKRCIIIDEGSTIYEGDIAQLKAEQQEKVVTLVVESVLDEARFQTTLANCTLLEKDGPHYTLQISERSLVATIEAFMASCQLADLHIVPPNLETVVERIWEQRSARKVS